MSTIKILSIVLFLFFSGCKEKEKNIFWISQPDGSENDLLYMAESTNVVPLENLPGYMTIEELVSAERLTFKNFGNIYENDIFRIFVFLREGSSPGRDYTFIIRTYDHHSKILGSYELATWIESEKRYCFGSINEKLVIKRSCDDGRENDIQQILSNGKIVSTTNYERK